MRLGDLVEIVPAIDWALNSPSAPSKAIKLSKEDRMKWEVEEDPLLKDYSGHPFATMEGDIVVSIRHNIGAALRITGEQSGAVPHRSFVILRSKNGIKSSQDWVEAWLGTNNFRMQVESRGQVNSLGFFRLRDLEMLEIPDPSEDGLARLEEIAQLLGRAETAVLKTLSSLQRLRKTETEILFTN